VVVRDLGSKNGVLVAGARVDSSRRLRDGDLVEIGPVTLRLDDPVDRYLRELEGEPPPPPAAPAGAPLAVPAPPPPPVPAPPRPARVGALTTAVAIGALVLVAAAAVTLLVAR